MVMIDRDLSQVEASNWQDVPPGVYLARYYKAEEWEGKDGRNSGVRIFWEIMDTDFAGMSITDLIILAGSDKAVPVGLRKLVSIGQAAGLADPRATRDTDEFEGYDLLLRVTYGKAGTDYADRTQVSSYHHVAEHEVLLKRQAAEAARAQAKAPAKGEAPPPPPPPAPQSAAPPPPPPPRPPLKKPPLPPGYEEPKPHPGSTLHPQPDGSVYEEFPDPPAPAPAEGQAPRPA